MNKDFFKECRVRHAHHPLEHPANMTKSQRLKPIIKLSDNRQQDAARAVVSSRRVLDERQSRLSDLNRYRDEYVSRLKNIGAAGISASQFHEYRVFLANLDLAITQQEKLVLMAGHDVEDKIRLWRQARGKAKALDTVSIKYRDEEQHLEDRREQLVSDDQAQRVLRKKNGAGPR
ncbi:MAG: flagellar export protein FliJ [Gammaproteobacteria bacterium]|nr:flagellar export protein FliJ [Gammaproteobacteria bacterium]